MRTFKVDGFDLCDREKRWFPTKETLVPVASTYRTVTVSSPFVDGARVVVQGVESKRVSLDVIVRGAEDVLAQRVGMVTRAVATAKVLTMVEGNTEFHAGVLEVVVSEAKWSVQRSDLGSVRFTVVFTVEPFWSSGSVVRSSARLQSGLAYFPMFDGCTGRLVDAVVTISGYTGSFTVTDPLTGTVWTGVASGRAVLDTANPAWSETSDYSGAGPLQVNPVFDEGGSFHTRLHVEVDNPSEQARIEIRGRKWFA